MPRRHSKASRSAIDRAVALALLACAAGVGHAANLTCTLATSGSWTVAGNWSGCNGGAGYPNNSGGDTFDAIIGAGTVTLQNAAVSFGNATVQGSGVWQIYTSAASAALSGAANISGAGLVDLQDASRLTTAGDVTLDSGGSAAIKVDAGGGSGGSQVVIGGNLDNQSTGADFEGGVNIGNPGMSLADSLQVNENLTNTGVVTLNGGETTAASASLNVAGGAPATLTGQYNLYGNVGGASIRWGSGGITQIGDGGANAGTLIIHGPNAYAEVGDTNSNSALDGLQTIASNGLLDLRDGTTVNIGNTLTVAGGGSARLKVDGYGGCCSYGGSTVTIAGDLINQSTGSDYDGGVSVGSGAMSHGDLLAVKGTLTNTGIVDVTGGSVAGATARLTVGGSAPGTTTGTYNILGNVGGAVLQWGSGGITQIGDGSTAGGDINLNLNGSNAFAEVGATNSNSALTGLTTIASNGQLELSNGAVVSTDGPLTVAGSNSAGSGGGLKVDYFGGAGGSQVTISGDLVNESTANGGGVAIGSGSMTQADQVTVTGGLTNTGGQVTLNGGQSAGARATLKIGGAAPATLTGGYSVVAHTGGAVLQWGSGGITQIGDGATNGGNLYIDGSNAYAEVGPTNSNSALTGLTTIASNGQLDLRDGAVVSTDGPLTVAGSNSTGNGGGLKVDYFGGAGGSQVTISGDLINESTANGGGVAIGNGGMTHADQVTVTGGLTNTGGQVTLNGGQSAGASATLKVGGAVPATLTGDYSVVANTGGAVLQWGSGGITQIGDGTANGGNLYIDGSNAYAEVGPTNSNSALTGLTTIASNGQLDVRDGAVVSTEGPLTVAGSNSAGNGGSLKVDYYGGAGGSQVTIGGNLANVSTANGGGVAIGYGGMTHADQVTVTGALTNTGGSILLSGGQSTGATAHLTVGGAAPGTLTGNYGVVANTGGAALQWGSGGITQIGDGGTNGGNLYIDGSNAYVEIGATNSNSALTGLTTIASNGQLDLRDGAVVSTDGSLTVAGSNSTGNGGSLKVDYYGGAGGSQVTLGGDLTNQSAAAGWGVAVGNGGMSKSDQLTVDGTLTNATGGSLLVQGNAGANATGTLRVSGAASNAGVISIGAGGVMSLASGDAYIQTVGSTTVNGTLSASTVNNQGGLLNGTGTIVGDVTNAGEISGGANGQFQPLTIQGALTNTATGLLASYESGSPATNTLVAVTGSLALDGGTLQANAVNGLTFAPGQSATVATFTPGAMSGMFQYLQNGTGTASTHPTYLDLGNGTTLDANYNVNSGNVELTTVATPTTTAESWNGGAGTWSTGADWSSAAAPLSYSDVTIGAGGGGTVTLNQDGTINSLTVQNDNALQYQSAAPAALTVGQNVSVGSGSSLALAATGDRLTAGGTLDNGGALTSSAGSTIQVMNFGGAPTAVNNTGTLTLGGQLQGSGALSNATAATVTLQGGTVATTRFVNAGSTSGYGTVAPTVTNSGTLTASGGTLSVQGGFTGNGTVQTSADGTLSLGADSATGTLLNDGALALNGHSITVSSAYDDGAAGTGNSFDNHAGVSGSGQILAAGADPSAAETVTVDGGAPTSGNVVMNFGAVRVGTSETQAYTIGNADSGGPALMGAIQTAAGGGTLTDTRLTGAGVTAGNWGPVQAGQQTSAYQVTFDATTAGALSGQTVHLANDFDNTNSQNISITGAAYAQALGQLNNTAANPDAFSFGTIQVGQTVTSRPLSVTNAATGPSGYVEDLNASFGSVGANSGTGAADIVGNGRIEGLLAGATNDSTMSVSVTGTAAGSIQSGIGVNFYTAGTVAGQSDGLGAALVGSANVPVDGTIQASVNVVNAADPVVNNAPISLGNVRQNATSPTAYVSLTNQATTAPQAALDASISGDAAVSATGQLSGLDPGETNDTALQVGLSTASAGHVSGLATLNLVSDASNIGGCDTHCTMSLPAQQVAVSGNVYRLADPQVNTTSVTLAARVGESAPSAAISVTNVSPDAYTEGLAATLGASTQGWTASGSISNLTAGATDANSLQVGLSTATAGVFNGNETVDFTSNGLIDNAQAQGVGSATVALQGNVYTAAVEHLNTPAVNFGVVHVGQAVADQAVSVSNTAARSALNDTLTGGLTMQPGSSSALSASGTLGAGVSAGQTNSGSLQVGLNTDVAGVYAGTAQFTGASHDPQLTDMQLATLGIAVSGQVNNYANAVFQLASGSGALSRTGSMYTLNLGNLTKDSSVSSFLSVLNDVSGPADNFGGTFSYGSLADLSLNGANWTAHSCSQSGYAFCLGAQGTLTGLGINVDTGTLGAFTDTIALNGMGFYQGASYSPYQQDLALTVEGNIVTGGGTSVPEPGTLSLFSAGVALLLAFARRRRIGAQGRGEGRC